MRKHFETIENPSSALYAEDFLSLECVQKSKKALLGAVRKLSESDAQAYLENEIATLFFSDDSEAQKHLKLEILQSAYHAIEKRKPRHDAMFNSCDKVLFETALAGAIHKQRPFLASGLWPVANKVAEILEGTLFHDAMMLSKVNLKAIRATFFKEILTWDCRDEFNKSRNLPLETPIHDSEIPVFKQWALKILRSHNPADITAQIFLIHTYVGFITRADRMHTPSIEEAPQELFLSQAEKSRAIAAYTQGKRKAGPGFFVRPEDFALLGKEDRTQVKSDESASRAPRITAAGKQLKSSQTTNPPHNVAGIVPGRGVRGSEDIDLSDLPKKLVELLQAADLQFGRTSAGVWRPCLPAADRERKKRGIPVSTDHFYEQAFHHDMPLIGGASGGIGTFEVAAALTETLTPDELKRFRALTTALYTSKGFHSLHEIGMMVNFFKPAEMRYKPGSYDSFIPDDVLRKDDLETLQAAFPDLLKPSVVHKGV